MVGMTNEAILQRAITLKQQSEQVEQQLNFVNEQIKELKEFSENLGVLERSKEKEVLTNSKYLEQPVVKDGQVITSRGVGTALAFGLAIIEELQGREKAQTVAERILFKAEC